MKRSLGATIVVYPTPVFIIGSYDDQDRPNIMNVAWGGVCCSKPPCLCISLRKATYTYGNIMKHRAFTVNIPSVSHVREADYVGLYSGKDENKFESLGLTAVKSDVVHAPYVGEFPLAVECRVIQVHELGLHTQFIGEIMDVKADADILNEKGVPDLAKFQPFTLFPADWGYYRAGEKIAHAFVVGKKEGGAGD